MLQERLARQEHQLMNQGGIDSNGGTYRNESGTVRDAMNVMSTPGNMVDTQ
jgi:hypothetical protein